MAAKCELCGKGPAVRQQRLARQQQDPPSLVGQPAAVKAKVEGSSNSKRMRVCTSCIKGGKIVKG